MLAAAAAQPVAVMPACKIPGLEHLNMATGIFIKQKARANCS